MKTVFVDANVFLRFLTVDDAGQHERSVALFRKAARGDVTLVTGPPVLFEIAWTLRSAYKLPREKVWDVLERIASLRGLRLTDGRLVEEAIALGKARGAEFADAYICAAGTQTGADEIATFNRKDFKRLDLALYAL